MTPCAMRVYVRGVGAITALGETWVDSLEPLSQGRSAIAPVLGFDVTDFPCTVAAAITAFDSTGDRRLALVKQALAEACQQADIDFAATEPRRLGIFLGAESGRAPFATVHALTRAAGGGAHFDHALFAAQAGALLAQFDAAMLSPAAVTSALAQQYQAHGPAVTLSLACASGASAIAEAARAIRLGLCDVALCGGVGADIDPLMLAGFGRLGALSAKGVSCPFDVRRDGFVVGEGAAMVVLANQRGQAKVEILGDARSLDAHHLTAPDPKGLGAEQAMRGALKAAGLNAVDYIQAHGTSTALNDEIEARIITKVMGSSIEKTHVSSIKGALGHWIAGAGALGFLGAYTAVAHGLMLPTAGLKNPDPSCPLPHVMHQVLQRKAHTAMVNAFAFGGANCSLILGAI
jgi:3-oxoacyl-(acyl-carrier-protein) synthase